MTEWLSWGLECNSTAVVYIYGMLCTLGGILIAKIMEGE